MKKISFNVWISVLIVGSILALIIGFFGFAQSSPIQLYDDVRDRVAVQQIFEENWDLLTNAPRDTNYFKLRFDRRSPTDNPKDFGSLIIKVYRENDTVVGFISYYMKNPFTGTVLFLAVQEKARGKGYARALLHHALNDLKAKGATQTQLITYLKNKRAQALYKSVGFEEAWKREEFVGFKYKYQITATRNVDAAERAIA